MLSPLPLVRHVIMIIKLGFGLGGSVFGFITILCILTTILDTWVPSYIKIIDTMLSLVNAFISLGIKTERELIDNVWMRLSELKLITVSRRPS